MTAHRTSSTVRGTQTQTPQETQNTTKNRHGLSRSPSSYVRDEHSFITCWGDSSGDRVMSPGGIDYATRLNVIHVLIVENMNLIRGGLVALLSGHPDMEVVAALESADKALPTALELEPDVVLLRAGGRRGAGRRGAGRPGRPARRPGGGRARARRAGRGGGGGRRPPGPGGPY